MAKEIYIDDENFAKGLQALEDTTKAPFGSARVMENCTITDKGGIAPRLGTSIIGTFNVSTLPIKSVYTYKKSFAANEILIKTYGTKFEAYSKNHTSAGWFLVKDGYTTGQEFGFVTSLVNTDNQDYCVFCNRYEPYTRWTGAIALLTSTLVGGETTIPVDTTLTTDTFDSQTATSNSATSFGIGTTPWVASQWNNFYVYIPSSGKVRKITATTTNSITFDTLGGAPGNVAFEIRQQLFPDTGSVIYNSNIVAYTSVDTNTTLITASAAAGTSGQALTLVPTEYPQNPRGNRLTSYLNRIIVGNVRSALARDSGGALAGYSNAGSYFVSKVNNPFDFTYSATRVAGEGDVVSTPYGGGNITDVSSLEDTAYVFKPRYIESVKYSQDANDLSVREPIKSEIGSVNRVIRGSDDVWFMTEDKKFTKIGRVKLKDVKPQNENIGYIIKRLLDLYSMDSFTGIEYADRIYFACKTDATQTVNNVVVVYNKTTESFEGLWSLTVNGFTRFNNLLCFGDSIGANVYQMLTGHADYDGTNRFPIISRYKSHYMNLSASIKGKRRGSHADLQAMHSMYFEGYIKGATQITFQAWKDFSDTPFLQFNFDGSETNFQDGVNLMATLGGETIGLAPMGSISSPDVEGYRHFQFRVYFPYQYGNHFSVGHQSENVDDDYEISRYGLGMLQDVSTDTNRIKAI